MCVESDGCEIEGCSSSDEVHTLSGSMSPALKSSPDLHPCKPGHKVHAALLRCRSPAAAAGILTFGNILNYMDRYTVAGKSPHFLSSSSYWMGFRFFLIVIGLKLIFTD
ncbi:hypothetical protein NL108_006804 [Boleophthalmus pectinirostris]|nr:hypothetical protein NL108_006804 [Boleophthalmus pectinirostris]